MSTGTVKPRMIALPCSWILLKIDRAAKCSMKPSKIRYTKKLSDHQKMTNTGRKWRLQVMLTIQKTKKYKIIAISLMANAPQQPSKMRGAPRTPPFKRTLRGC